MLNRCVNRIGIVVALAFTVSLFTSCASEAIGKQEENVQTKVIDPVYSDTIKYGGTQTVASSGGRELVVVGWSADIEVRDTATGVSWRSTPEDRDRDPIASGDYANQLASQVVVQYYRMDNGAEVTADSYACAVLADQFGYYPVEGGIGVQYIIGEKLQIPRYPTAISVDRMDAFLAKLPESAQKVLLNSYSRISIQGMEDEASKAWMLQNYPTLRDRDLYILGGLTIGSIVPGSVLAQEIEEAFLQAGYTLSDLEQDNRENELDVPEQREYTVTLSVEYTLEDGALVARIPRDSIVYDTKALVLTDITLLPYFGAPGLDETEGYVFVPDGSGALLRFDDARTSVPAFHKVYYSRDKSVSLERQDLSDDSPMLFPIYGISRKNQAFLASIEKGDAMASLTADTAGKTSSYPFAYPTFTLKQRHIVGNSVLNLAGNIVYQKASVSTDIQVRYLFQTGEQADYNGMAAAYREYLLKTGRLVKTEPQEESLPLYIQFIGAVDYKKTFLGVPVDSELALTTYPQAIEILEKLSAGGVKQTVVGYDGWANGGVASESPGRAEPMDILGGRKGFEALKTYLTDHGIHFYPKTELMYVEKETAFDGFSKNQDAAKNLEKNNALDYAFHLSTLERDSTSRRWVVSPSRYGDYVDKLLEKFPAGGIDPGAMSTDINSDFSDKTLFDRVGAQTAICEQLAKMKNAGLELSVQGASLYTLAYANLVVGSPMASGGSYILSEDIPFIQLVLHGIVPYTSPALNLSDRYEEDMLRAVETGSIPAFRFIYEDNASLMETDYNYYSVHYGYWLEDALTVYEMADQALSACQNSIMLRHDKVAEGVYRIQYENGHTVFVNYNEQAVQYGDVMIPAQGTAVA